MRFRIYACVCATLFLVASLSSSARAVEFLVSNASDLGKAIGDALPGDTITILPGYYVVSRNFIGRPGAEGRPITLRAATLGSVLLETNAIEEFVVAAPYWVFENLVLTGAPYTEHAFHIVGKASHTIVRNVLAFNFDAMIKANGDEDQVTHELCFPDDVLIESNIFINTALRSGNAPVTPVDVVGGKNWVVRSNFIADFGSNNPNRPSYGAFLKGNSQNGVMERNLVACEWRVPGGAIRIGLSLGGGGTGAGYCGDKDCSYESRRGTIRNNIIMNCAEDIGVYLNKASESTVADNTFYNTYGIDARYPETSATIVGNIISARARSRDNGTLNMHDNLVHGSTYGLLMHQGFVFLSDKVIGASNKYPSIFWPWLMAWIKDGPLTYADRVLGNTWLGRGSNTARSLFVDPDAFDFNLHRELTQRAEKAGEGQDFCGRPRASANPSFGAIEYSAGPCDVSAIVVKADALMRALPKKLD